MINNEKSDNWWPAKITRTQATLLGDRQLRMQKLLFVVVF